MIIDQNLLDDLSVQAKANPRLRQSYDLRTTPEDKSQRMLNALEPGTIIPIHRHRKSTETMVMVRGKLIERFFDEEGNVTDEYVMSPLQSFSNSSTPSTPVAEPTCNEPVECEVPMVQIEAGCWHSLEVLEEGTIVFEAKDGAYEPLSEIDFK